MLRFLTVFCPGGFGKSQVKQKWKTYAAAENPEKMHGDETTVENTWPKFRTKKARNKKVK
jgi:hypothetical protein